MCAYFTVPEATSASLQCVCVVKRKTECVWGEMVSPGCAMLPTNMLQKLLKDKGLVGQIFQHPTLFVNGFVPRSTGANLLCCSTWRKNQW